MNLPFFIAKRYFLFKKSSHIVNIISWISILSIMICTASFIVILSVFNGIDGLIKSLYNAYHPDLKLSPQMGKTLRLTEDDLQYLQNKNLFKSVAMSVEIDAIIQLDHSQYVVKLQGIDTILENTIIENDFIKQGSALYPIRTNTFPILLSQSLANAMGMDVDINPSELTIYNTPIQTHSINLEQELSANHFLPVGEFSIHKDIDYKYCFAPLSIIKKISGVAENEYTNVSLMIQDNSQTQSIKHLLQKKFPTLKIETLYEQNHHFFSILETERISIIFILSFIILIASFNIAGTINLLIMEKIKQIYLLKSFGAKNNLIKKIFLYCGLNYGLSGLILGFGLGTLICFLQIRFHLLKIQGAFIIDYFPVKIKLSDFLITGLIVLVITSLATAFAIFKLQKELNKKQLLQNI